MTASLTRPKYALAALAAISLAGTADVAEFLATRPQLFHTAPGRAAGSVLGLAIWTSLLGLGLVRMRRDHDRVLAMATIGLAAINALGNVGLTFIHFKAGVGGWRPLASGMLGVAALLVAILAREP